MRTASLILGLAAFSGAFTARSLHAEGNVTNVHQIRVFEEQGPGDSYSFHLQGDVWWANPSTGNIVLKDDSGAEELELDFTGEPIRAGQRIALDGDGTIVKSSGAFKIGNRRPVVNNDGVHGMVEKSGAAFLKAGRNPIRVEWFNGVEKYGLRADYQGPGISRRAIPDSALFHRTSESNWEQGLEYRCVEAPDERLPDFDRSEALGAGVVNTFNLAVMSRPEHVALSFTGFLEVPQNGLYTFYTTSDDGSRLLVGQPSIDARVLGESKFPKPQAAVIGEIGNPGKWVALEGKVTFASEQPQGLSLELSARTGRIEVKIPAGSGLAASMLKNRNIRATGFCEGALTIEGQRVVGILMVPSSHEIEIITPDRREAGMDSTNSEELPLLVNASDVHHLKREEAQRGYPVRIQGVVTSVLPEHQAFTVQDSTRGIYVVDFSKSRSQPPDIGESLTVRGTTDPSFFAPVVNALDVQSLGAGQLPEPVHPTRDQLMNGSLDAQYVEIEGILTSVQVDGVTMLTSDGRIKADLQVAGLKTADLARYEDALVRVRGCLFATWDYITHRVKMDEIRIKGAAITVEQPAPADLFSAPLKKASDLLLFDPQAGVFQRVKLSGQIIHARNSEFFMMDGSNGVRFVAKRSVDLQVGDRVDVVGFPDLNSASPVLCEAVVRKTAHIPLPQPKSLGIDDLISAGMDSTWVRVKALLVNKRTAPAEETLEMRAGLRSFLAVLPTGGKNALAIPNGSQLELTGTWVVQRVNQDVASFELLLNTPSDIAVLAHPPWWTLQRLLVILGALACVLAITVLWITQLRRKVEQRSTELENQIRKRQRIEQQHAMEQERARIAQDLHDELGSGLTEITMLGARAQSGSAAFQARDGYLEQMAVKARQMVSALDEIVWAMNPTHDSLASMVSYFSIYAERFLGLANIAWRLDGPFKSEDYVVDSRHRHELFLAFKEALTNVVRHSGATEVCLNIQVADEQVRLTIVDNGRGWAGNSQTEEMDGVLNMRTRLKKLGGQFEVTTNQGRGTIVRFDVPLT
jgi:signal transduction histidine kinase